MIDGNTGTVSLFDWLLHQDLVSYTAVRNLHNGTTARVALPCVYEWLDKKNHNLVRNTNWGPYITSNMFPCYTFSWSFVGLHLDCLHLCIFIAVLSRIKIDETPIALQVFLHPYSKGWIQHKTEKKEQLLSVPLYAVILFTLCKKHIERYHGLPLERLLDNWGLKRSKNGAHSEECSGDMIVMKSTKGLTVVKSVVLSTVDGKYDSSFPSGLVIMNIVQRACCLPQNSYSLEAVMVK